MQEVDTNPSSKKQSLKNQLAMLAYPKGFLEFPVMWANPIFRRWWSLLTAEGWHSFKVYLNDGKKILVF
jgi:hypothetical protein